MSHSALLHTAFVSGPAAVGRSPASQAAPRPLDAAKRLFRRLHLRLDSGYRPERHYMRGGRTPGAKSLARG